MGSQDPLESCSWDLAAMDVVARNPPPTVQVPFPPQGAGWNGPRVVEPRRSPGGKPKSQGWNDADNVVLPNPIHPQDGQLLRGQPVVFPPQRQEWTEELRR